MTFKVGDRVQHPLYSSGTVRVMDGRQAKVLFDRDAKTRAQRRVWMEDLRPGAPRYEGKPTPAAALPELVA